MTHLVRILPTAHCDMSGIASYIRRKKSPAVADRWHAGIIARIRSLESNPEMWPVAYETEIAGFELRELPFGRRKKLHRILFEIAGDEVLVHRIRHAAQDYLTADDF